ncbi:MAG: SBBP repeat-containing protein [Deltaproteobacteria bacterium]|nr:SBBP repeat-containing protein [Deltaproteobacteria bacterium]
MTSFFISLLIFQTGSEGLFLRPLQAQTKFTRQEVKRAVQPKKSKNPFQVRRAKESLELTKKEVSLTERIKKGFKEFGKRFDRIFDLDPRVIVRFNLCGNGVLNGGERCDDGNRVSGDGCSEDCVIECELPQGVLTHIPECPASCGNGILEVGEECDEGLANSDTVVGACPKNCIRPVCGNGIVEAGEACDGGFGCTDRCVRRPPTPCDPAGKPKSPDDPIDPHYALCESPDTPWRRILGEPGTIDDHGVDIAADMYGTLYTVTNADSWTTVVRQFDACGNLIWELPFSGKYASGIDIDACGNSYITGQNFFGPEGLFIARVTHEGESGGGFSFNISEDTWDGERSSDITVDRPNKRLYVTGSTGPFMESEIFVRRYDFTPFGITPLVWGNIVNGTSEGETDLRDYGSGVAVDSVGNLYVTGTVGVGSWPSTPSISHLWLAKYSSGGSQLWSLNWSEDPELSSQSSDGKDLAVDPEGNIHVATHGLIGPPWSWPVVAKYSSDGERIGLLTRTNDQAREINGIAVNAEGEIQIAGDQRYMGGIGSEDDIDRRWAARFNTDYSADWEHCINQVSGSYGFVERFSAVTVDPTGAVYFIGSLHNPPVDPLEGFYMDIVIEKYLPDGTGPASDGETPCLLP